MKLLFPNGEHGPVELKEGTTRVGSGAGADVTIVAPGIASQHCTIEYDDGGSATVRVPVGSVVVVNGKQVSGEATIKPGDLLLFSKVGARVVSIERAAPAPVRRAEPDDTEKTRIRMALPKFVLRGVSGSTFGKTFPLFGTVTVGRSADCDISIPGEEISRHHAKLQVMPDGVSVEDLGSANGTFIAGKRVHHGTLKAGEELRLDTVRFLLVAPGAEAQPATKPAPVVVPEPPKKTPAWLWLAVGMLGAGGVIAALIATGVVNI